MATRFRCTGCHRVFATERGGQHHVETRHPNGALWSDGDLTVWREADIGLGDDMKYWAICEIHGSCSGFMTKAEAMSASVMDFCEACSGTAETGDYVGYVAPQDVTPS